MSFKPVLSWFANPKNSLLVVLALVAAVELGLLLSGPSTPPDEARENDKMAIDVADLTLDMNRMRDLYLEFTYPLGLDQVGMEANASLATFSPEIDGIWSWVSPTMLNFKAEEPFSGASEYELALNPPALLGPDEAFVGETLLTFKTGTFKVEQIRLEQQPDPGGPTMVTIGGQIRFNTEVDPETLLGHIKLIDPLRGEEDPVPLALLDAYSSRSLSFRSAPLEKTDQARDLILSVAPDLLPSMGNIPLGQEASQTINLYLDPTLQVQKTNYSPTGNRFDVVLSFTSPVAAETAQQYLTVTPDQPVRLSASGSSLIIHGDFLPGRAYTVGLDAGLTAIDGAVLEKAYSAAGTMPNLEPRVDFAAQGMFLSAKDSRQMVLETVNAPKAQLVVDRVYRSNLFSLFSNHPWRVFDPSFWDNDLDHSLGDRILEKDLTFDSAPNEIVRTPVDLGAIIDAEAPGIYRIGMLMPNDYRGPQRWVMVTDVGLVAKRGTDSMLVWAVSLKDSRPLPGVKLTLLSDQNQVLASGTTDAQGLWRKNGLDTVFKEHVPWLVLAEKGEDMSFLLMDRFRADMTGLDVAGTFAPSGYLAFAWGERDIYRPGETVRGVVAVRDAGMNTPGAMPLTLTRMDPQGRVLGSLALTTDNQGTAEFEVDVPDFALTGHYWLEIRAGEDVIGEYRYQVEEFIPDRISVDIETKSASLAPGDRLEFTVASNYLFGAPASGLPVEARVELLPVDFAPEDFSEYVFGDPERPFPATDIYPPGGGEQLLNLDDEGNLAFQVAVPLGLTPPAALRAQITARVSERGGRGVSARQGVVVHPYPYYLGIKQPVRDGSDPGQPREFHYVSLTPDATPADHGVLTATLYKDVWQSILTITPSGDYKFVSERDPVMLSSTTIPAGQTEGVFQFTPPIYGSYRVVLEDKATGAASQVSFYAGGWGYSPWALENPARIDIVPDKENYRAGETATFQVRAPFPGKLLVTVEGRDVLETKIIELTGNTGQISLPAKASYAPNVYVTAVLVRSAEDLLPGEPGRAVGSAPFFVGLDAGWAAVDVTAPETMRPENGLDIEITAPPGSRVTVAAVDEGILQLINQATPNPFDFFYAKRGLEVETMDVFSLLFPEAAALMGLATPGGGEDLEQMKQFVRTESLNRVQPVAFFSGLLTADASGRIRYHVDVPEFAGALRVMAVAVDHKTFGADQTLTRVKSPLTVTPTLPRFLAPDEKLQVPVVVRNDTENPAMLTVTLAVEGAAIVPTPEQGFMLDPGRDTIVYFDLETGPAEGKVTVRAEVAGGGESAGSTTELYVRSAMPFERDALAGSVTEGETELPGAGETFVPETVTRTLTIGGMPLMRFTDNLDQLIRYPYGCIEQTVSRAFPLLYFEDLARQMDPELLGANIPSRVYAAITRIRIMQTDNGGFALWPGDYHKASPYLSAYATHFLVEARAAGYQVDDDFLNLSLEYLRDMIHQSRLAPYELTRVSYALYVLALAGTPDLSTMDLVRPKIDSRQHGEATALLAAAYAAVGDVKNVRLLLSGDIQVPDLKRQLSGDYGSTVRNLGLAAMALIHADPTDQRLPDMINTMAALIEPGRWYTTQENAVALMALGQFFRLQAEAPPFSGRVLMDGKVLGEFSTNATLSLNDPPADKPVTIVMDPGYRPGTVFYSQIIRGAPIPAAYEPLSDGIEIERALLDREGNPIDPASIRQGDLIVLKTDLRSAIGPVDNMALQILLPTGLEVENPRLSSTEILDWMGGEPLESAYQDLRDDRVLVFADLPVDKDHPNKWYTVYSLVRAVTPGTFILPPVRAEAMYDPTIRASGPVAAITVTVRP